MPKHNWGGAFLVDSANTYSQDLLAEKDGFDGIDTENYDQLSVKVVEGKRVFSEVFRQINTKHSGAKKGVVKIDVEGFEYTIIQQLAQAIPSNVELLVIFENWDKNLKIEEILNLFDGRVSAFKVRRKKLLSRNIPYAFKALLYAMSLPFNFFYHRYSLLPLVNSTLRESLVGDVVLKVTDKS